MREVPNTLRPLFGRGHNPELFRFVRLMRRRALHEIRRHDRRREVYGRGGERMNTLADFKRALATEGVQVETLALARGVKGGPLKVGMIRTVVKINTVGVYLSYEGGPACGSWLEFDKAGDWLFEGDTATNTLYGYAYRVLMPSEVSA